MVAHTFSCPQGLFFNEITDGCDFLRNVECGDKDTQEPEPTKKDPDKSADSSSSSVASEEESRALNSKLRKRKTPKRNRKIE
jgi:hypothetical protein